VKELFADIADHSLSWVDKATGRVVAGKVKLVVFESYEGFTLSCRP